MVLSSRFAEDFAGFKDPAGEPEISFRRGWIPARMVVDQDERISAEGDYWFKNSGLKSGLAAVDWNRCSANERSLVGCDKKDGFGDFFRAAHAFKRNAGSEIGLLLVRPSQACEHFRFDRARGDDI